MTRKLRSTVLETRTARARLKPRAKPFKAKVQPLLDVGYRPAKKGAGRWLAIEYLGSGRYRFTPIGIADDHADADGASVLDWGQALDKARKIAAANVPGAEVKQGRTVGEHLETYLRWVFGFIGIKHPEFISADGVQIGPVHRQKALAGALEAVTRLEAA